MHGGPQGDFSASPGESFGRCEARNMNGKEKGDDDQEMSWTNWSSCMITAGEPKEQVENAHNRATKDNTRCNNTYQPVSGQVRLD